jgi:mono/diheme cytochrome c family protein
MYHHIVLLHRIIVSVFLFHYLWKSYLLLSNKNETLANYSAKTRIAEMVVSFLFLATGLYLVVEGPALNIKQYIKFALVFASIPLAVIGFKKGKKAFAAIAVLFLLGAYGLAESYKKHKGDGAVVAVDGKMIYEAKCVSCHGDAGDAQIGGAKNLKMTQLSAEQQKALIKGGGTGMPAQPDLTDEQLNSLVGYVSTLK